MPEKKVDHDAVANELKRLLSKYTGGMSTSDSGASYMLNAPPSAKYEKEMFFAGLRHGKAYVSFYLNPVYLWPEMLNDVSPELRKRMQGKSCFNFTSVDKGLFKELAGLTKRGHARFKKAYL